MPTACSPSSTPPSPTRECGDTTALQLSSGLADHLAAFAQVRQNKPLPLLPPRSKHVFANKGIGGTSSGIFTACVEALVPPEADLVRTPWDCCWQADRRGRLGQAVRAGAAPWPPYCDASGSPSPALPRPPPGVPQAIVEFTYNEPDNEPFDSPPRRGFEELLRKLLKLKNGWASLAARSRCPSSRHAAPPCSPPPPVLASPAPPPPHPPPGRRSLPAQPGRHPAAPLLLVVHLRRRRGPRAVLPHGRGAAGAVLQLLRHAAGLCLDSWPGHTSRMRLCSCAVTGGHRGA